MATYSVMNVLLSLAKFGGGRAERARPKSHNCGTDGLHGTLLVSLLVDLEQTVRWDLQTLRSQFAFSKRFDGFKSR